jgi:small Trp-rich protein
MLFLIVGVALLAMKFAEYGPVAAWPWYVVLAPFALAVAWWSYADASGYSKRKVMEKENARRKLRIEKNKAAIGTLNKKRR